jgi:hypothetical protein
MAAQPLGKLWILLHPTEEELRDMGSRLNYQQQIIFEVVKQYGFDRQVFIQTPATGELGRIPVVLQHLHQLLHLNHTSDYLVIQDVPEVTVERLYQYNWGAGYTFRTVTYTGGRRNTQQLKKKKRRSTQGN